MRPCLKKAALPDRARTMSTPETKSTAPAPHASHDSWSACRDLRSFARFLVPVILLLVLDLWSKHWVFANLGPNEVVTVLSGVLEFRRSLNAGAVFGSFEGMVSVFIGASIVALLFVFYLFASSSRSQRLLHVCLGMILAGAIGNLYDRAFMKADVVIFSAGGGIAHTHIGRVLSDESDPIVRVGSFPEGADVTEYEAGQIVSVRKQGVVRDFIKFVPRFPAWIPKLGGVDVWPWVFNVADAALVCGVIAMLGYAWFGQPAGSAARADGRAEKSASSP